MYERLFGVAKGQIFIALLPAFLLKSVQGSLHISSGQQEWPSVFRWLFTIDYQRYSEILQFLTVGTVSTCTKILQIALITLTACFYVHQIRLFFITTGNSGHLVQIFTGHEDLFADQTLSIVHFSAVSFPFLFYYFLAHIATEQNSQYSHFFGVTIYL